MIYFSKDTEIIDTGVHYSIPKFKVIERGHVDAFIVVWYVGTENPTRYPSEWPAGLHLSFPLLF
jgi:hypothetical protein